MRNKSQFLIILFGVSLLLLACSLPILNNSPESEAEPQTSVAEPVSEEPQPEATQEQHAEEVAEPLAAVEEPEANQMGGGVVIDPLIISTDQGVWLYEEISGELNQLNVEHLDAPRELEPGLSQDKQTFAYVTGLEEGSTNPRLLIIDLLNKSVLQEIELSGPQSQLGSENEICSKPYEARRALSEPNNLAWSVNNVLAFVSAKDGETADVYLYDRAQNSVTRISEEESQATDLHWSPDGLYLEYESVGCFGTGAGSSMAGIWGYDTQSGKIAQLERNMASGGENLLGWMNEHTFVIGSWSTDCMSHQLRTIDMQSGSFTAIMPGCFSNAAFDTQTKKGFVTMAEVFSGECFCGTAYDPGTYTFSDTQELEVYPQFGGEFFNVVSFSQMNGFKLFSEDGLSVILNNDYGQMDIPKEVKGLNPLLSTSGKWAWMGYMPDMTGLWITDSDGSLRQVDPTYSTFDYPWPVWSTDGETLYYAVGDTVMQDNNQVLTSISGAVLENIAK